MLIFQNSSIITSKLHFNIIPAFLVSQQGDKWELWSDCSNFWYLQQSILYISEPELSEPLHLILFHFTSLTAWEAVGNLSPCFFISSVNAGAADQNCYPSFIALLWAKFLFVLPVFSVSTTAAVVLKAQLWHLIGTTWFCFSLMLGTALQQRVVWCSQLWTTVQTSLHCEKLPQRFTEQQLKWNNV